MQLRVKTYVELIEYIATFNRGAIDVLVIEGTAGAGKSSILRETMKASSKEEGKDYAWLEGRITAAAMYHRLYEHRDVPIILDDIDGLYRDKECVNLLKCLCNTWAEKTLMWNTMQRLNKQGGNAPTSFKTTSKVCIITNSWKSLNKNVGAIEDRGLLIFFRPDAQEVHQYVKNTLGNLPEIFDEEIFEFIGSNLSIIAEPSIRHYRNALQLKKGDANWKKVLIESFGLNENEMEVLQLCADKSLSHNQRSELFASRLKKSGRTYWRTKTDLKTRGLDLD